jgi:tRNA(fMet)-specific endonuclease VapC
MKRYVLDTSTLLHYIRGKTQFENIESDLGLLKNDVIPILSSVTIGEIEAFVQRQNWGEPKLKRMKSLLDKMFIVDINAKDEKLMQAYATLWNYSKNALPDNPFGKSIGIGQNDVWIAATALAANAVLVSTDNDFNHLENSFLTIKIFKS